MVEGLILGGYKYSGLRSESAAETTTYTVVAEKSAQEEFDSAKITAESVLIARDLVNTPSNLLYPETYAAFLSAQAAETAKAAIRPASIGRFVMSKEPMPLRAERAWY